MTKLQRVQRWELFLRHSVGLFSFKIKVGIIEKLAKSSDCSTKTYATTLAATSIFRTELRLTLVLAMCAGLAHSVGRSWCGVINSPATTFAVIKQPRGTLSQRRDPLHKLLWADLLYKSSGVAGVIISMVDLSPSL